MYSKSLILHEEVLFDPLCGQQPLVLTAALRKHEESILLLGRLAHSYSPSTLETEAGGDFTPGYIVSSRSSWSTYSEGILFWGVECSKEAENLA